jgi:hypothetical protein
MAIGPCLALGPFGYGSLAWAYALWLWAPCLGVLPLLKAKSRVLYFLLFSILIFIYREDKKESWPWAPLAMASCLAVGPFGYGHLAWAYAPLALGTLPGRLAPLKAKSRVPFNFFFHSYIYLSRR